MDESSKEVREALLFAKQIADGELQRIERMHNKSIWFLGILAAGFAFALGVFGWVGYTNLKTVAIATAQAQVQAEVKRQVQDKLTKASIEDVVKSQIVDFTQHEMRTQIHSEVATGPLRKEILAMAASQTHTLVTSMLAPRHITTKQRALIRSVVQAAPFMKGISLSVQSIGTGSETRAFANELGKVLREAGLDASTSSAMMTYDEAAEGLTLEYDDQLQVKYVNVVLECLRSWGITVRTKPRSPGAAQPNPMSSMVLYVGSQKLTAGVDE